MDLQRVKIPKAGQLAADQIRNRILTNDMTLEDVLPPEADLMRAMGVSRETIRQALRILETEGLIALTGGKTGARIRKPSLDVVSLHVARFIQSRNISREEVEAAKIIITMGVEKRLSEISTNEGNVLGCECLAVVYAILISIKDHVKSRKGTDLDSSVTHAASAQHQDQARIGANAIALLGAIAVSMKIPI